MQDAIFISAPQPVYFPVPVSKDSIAENLSIGISVVSNEYPIDFIEAGNRTLIVPINSLENEINIFPNEQRLKKFSLDNGIDVILIFCKDVADGKCFMHTRVFAAKYGYLEDPATGSANSAFGYYLIKNKLWNGEPIKLEQGGKDRIFNTVELYCSDNLVHFGGKATARIEGVYYI